MTNTFSFTGNIGNDAEVRSAGQDRVANFSVAVKHPQKDGPTLWVRVDLWGKRADSLAPYLKKGGKVFVSGEMTLDEYQGKTQVRCRADRLDPFMGAKREGAGQTVTPQSDLDDDVPF